MLEQKINNQPTTVVGGLIYQNKKILICQRKKESDHSLKWEFPGGKIKDFEENQEALKRELKEELNIEIIKMSFFDEYLYEYKELSKKLKLVFYQIFQFEGEMQNLVHHQLKWIDISNLSDYDFLEGDQKIIDKLIQNDSHI
ncbi:(deoxy)nucleoside triphosphate pyrophosphohydrolase [Alphaproteobacteria bacterium]|nr:(deoxy)nucleoside triphosphate pyrophosphohydrolase [Alphaproteobacteria bacterium]